MKTVTCSYNGVEYELIDAPLWWHDAGLTQTATGYGAKLTTRYKVNIGGKSRRVYITCFSNAASLWVVIDGAKWCLS